MHRADDLTDRRRRQHQARRDLIRWLSHDPVPVSTDLHQLAGTGPLPAPAGEAGFELVYLAGPSGLRRALDEAV